MSHNRTVVDEFTHQAERFNVSPVQNSAATVQTLLDLVPCEAGADWLEVACGTGILSRSLAPSVGSVLGIDLTPAMLAVATREATRAGLNNLRYQPGDATRLEMPEATFDGAMTRFSLHHIPLPGRVIQEMARVVRPAGWVVLADHIGPEDLNDFNWHQDLERLRDPSHWATLTPAQLRALARTAGLTLIKEATLPFALEFDEWLSRGSGGPGMRELIEMALDLRPAGVSTFRVEPDAEGRRQLHLVYYLSLWQTASPDHAQG